MCVKVGIALTTYGGVMAAEHAGLVAPVVLYNGWRVLRGGDVRTGAAPTYHETKYKAAACGRGRVGFSSR